MKNSIRNFAQGIDLDDYAKDNSEKLDAVTTSLTIERKHKEFLDAHNLNLSKLVRVFLDALILVKGKPNEK